MTGHTDVQIRKAKVAKAIHEEGMRDIAEIALYTNYSEATVKKDISELLSMDQHRAIATRDVEKIVLGEVDKIDYLWEHLKDALERTENPLMKANIATQGAKLIDTLTKLLKSSGIFVEKTEQTVTYASVQDLEEVKQIAGMYEEFLMNIKCPHCQKQFGIAIEKFFQFVTMRTKGTRNEVKRKRTDIVVEAEEVEDDEGE